MKTTDREHSERLVKAGWVKETYFRLTPVWDKNNETTAWIRVDRDDFDEIFLSDSEWLPAPTTYEIGEDLSLEDLVNYYTKVLGRKVIHEEWEGNYETYTYYLPIFVQWLYATLLDPNAMAVVWCGVKGDKG